MSNLPGDELLKCISSGYRKAKEHADDDPRTVSSRFVDQVATQVHKTHFGGYCLRTIRVDDSGNRSSGEWLVDACITKDICLPNPHSQGSTRFIESIVFAMESESQTGARAFNTDFAKLLHLNATVKLYLNGVNQTERPLEHYMEHRRKYAETILRGSPPKGQFFFAFWPSPAKSLWRKGIPKHLDTIRLWEWKGDKLWKVPCGDGP